MALYLTVDRTWCAKCKICLSFSKGTIRFDAENYPEETVYRSDELHLVLSGVKACPVQALALKEQL